MKAFPCTIDKLEEIIHSSGKLKGLRYGPIIVRCIEYEQAIAFIFWKGIKNCNLLIGKEEQKYIDRIIELSERELQKTNYDETVVTNVENL